MPEDYWGPGAAGYPHMEWIRWDEFGYACLCDIGEDHD